MNNIKNCLFGFALMLVGFSAMSQTRYTPVLSSSTEFDVSSLARVEAVLKSEGNRKFYENFKGHSLAEGQQ